MYKGYKVIAVTPAGRQRFLKILLRYTFANRDILDQHDLWVNTKNKEDIEYIKTISGKYPSFIKLVMPTRPVAECPSESTYQFFKYCTDAKTIYVRFDDDICCICPGAIKSLVDFRITNPYPFLVYPIVICNNMEWILKPFEPVVSWKKGADRSLEHIRRHVEFLSDPYSSRYQCDPYIIPYHLTIGINCICWLGKDFKEFDGIVPPWPVNEETWLTNIKPKELQRANCISGEGVVVHFSYTFSNTMSFLETHTNLYQRYSDLAKSIIPIKAL